MLPEQRCEEEREGLSFCGFMGCTVWCPFRGEEGKVQTGCQVWAGTVVLELLGVEVDHNLPSAFICI